MPPSNRRRVCIIAMANLPIRLPSRLQLAFEFVQKAPIRAVGGFDRNPAMRAPIATL